MKLKFRRALLASTVLALVIGFAAAGTYDMAKKMSVKGEVVDLACYISHEAKGPDHAACARKCLEGGQPMGLLAEDGTLYLLFAPHASTTAYDQAKENAGKTVEVEGTISNRGGIKAIEVTGVKAA